MPDSAAHDPIEARRRKLDALFEQQPFLSPTMRAWLVSSDSEVPGGVAVAGASLDADRAAERRRALHVVSARTPRPVPAPPKRRRRAAEAAPTRVVARNSGEIVRLEVRFRPRGSVAAVGACPEEGRLLTVPEVAGFLRIAPVTVRRWVGDGRLAAVRAGRLLRFRVGDVQAVLTPAGPSVAPRV